MKKTLMTSVMMVAVAFMIAGCCCGKCGGKKVACTKCPAGQCECK